MCARSNMGIDRRRRSGGGGSGSRNGDRLRVTSRVPNRPARKAGDEREEERDEDDRSLGDRIR